MKFAADTGALLSLACSAYFELIMKEYALITTPAVIKELGEFAQYNDFLGKKAEMILRADIPVQQPKIPENIDVSAAEREVFALARELKIIPLTDDMQAARSVYERMKVRSRPSFYLLLLLYKKKKLTKEEVISDMNSVLRYRNWLSGALWEYALRLIREM